MRIRSAYINGFKNLNEFELVFGADNPTTVIVGRNGTGKSNFLEALALIFRDLDLGRPSDFEYRIEYEIAGQTVLVDALKRSARRVFVDGERVAFADLAGPDRAYLPRFVFGYYSGTGNRLARHFVEHQDRYYDELVGARGHAAAGDILRPFFYVQPFHSQFALLAFFLENDEDMLGFLRDYLGIEGLESVLVRLHEPSWKRSDERGDSRFWGAVGVASVLLAHFYDHAMAPLRVERSLRTGPRRNQRREELYLYLPDVSALRSVWAKYPSAQAFFTALESTEFSELLGQIYLRVRMSDGHLLTFAELSEGEQQLLMVLGLLRFTEQDESLFLLDEPDTHLNPAWSLEYLDLLDRFTAGASERNQTVMATHDPLVVANLTKEQVRIIDRDEESGRLIAYPPSIDPRGQGVAALLTSEVYGLRSQLDLETLRAVDEHTLLASKPSLTPGERQRLAVLDQRLEDLGFARATRDPAYDKYVTALTRYEAEHGLLRPSLSRDEQEERDRVAEEILAAILNEG